MKKFTFLLTLAIGSKVLALPIGNPAEPALFTEGCLFNNCCWSECFSFRIGYYGDFVYNRHLTRSSATSHGQFDNSTLNTNAGLLALNFWKRVDIFATLGASTGSVSSRSNFIGFGRFDAVYGSNFSWSVGGRAVLWQCGCTFLGVEGQYFSTHMPLSRFVTLGAGSAYPNSTTFYSEWQVGGAIAHRINMLVPYIGVKYSRSFLDNRGIVVLGSTLPNNKSRKHWGYAVGVTLVDRAIATVTAEGRFADEKAFHINAQVRF